MAKKVLLIDDDTDDREMFCEALAEIAPEIVCYTAANCRKALAMLANKEVETPHVIFLDVNMPITTGWQCLSLFKEKEEYKHVPIIMYSTTSHREDIDRALQLGALCFYTKPPDYKHLKRNLEVVALHLKNGSLSLLTQNSPEFVAADDK